MWSSNMRRDSQILILMIQPNKADNFFVSYCFFIPCTALPLSLEPINRFQRELLQKVASKMIFTSNQKNWNWNWLTSDSFCSSASQIMQKLKLNPSNSQHSDSELHIVGQQALLTPHCGCLPKKRFLDLECNNDYSY